MVYLKEDGSVDVERINQLPLEEWMDVVGEMTDEQYAYFESKTPLNESTEPYKGVIVSDKLFERIERDYIKTEKLFKEINENKKKQKK